MGHLYLVSGVLTLRKIDVSELALCYDDDWHSLGECGGYLGEE